jgi:DNA-binding NtrC family response regulator
LSHFDTGKKTVIICDDELDLRQLFGKDLKSKHNVILVGSGEDCIESSLMKKSRGKKIHPVLLDYRLGSMYG